MYLAFRSARHVASVLLFAGAVGMLVVYGSGPLFWPGIGAAAAAAALSLFGYLELAALIGTVAACVSFIGQAVTVYCPYCTLAASMFAAGAAFSIWGAVREKQVIGLFLIGAIALSALFLAVRVSFGLETGFSGFTVVASNAEGIQTGATGTTPDGSVRPNGVEMGEPLAGAAPGASAKPALYFSPHCKYCAEAVAVAIQMDPEGSSWLPVIVPVGASEEGVEELRRLGYRGTVAAAEKSPGGGVPCIKTPDGTVYLGKSKVIGYLTQYIKRREGN